MYASMDNAAVNHVNYSRDGNPSLSKNPSFQGYLEAGMSPFLMEVPLKLMQQSL